MKIRAGFLPLIAAVCVLAGCGGSSSPHPLTTPGHPCTTGNFYMQCVVSHPGFALSPFTGTHIATGVDFGWGGPSVAWMRQNHVRFAASYLSTDASKDWTLPQIRAYHAAGIATIAVWETTQTRALDGFVAGEDDAHAAAYEARQLGEPDNRPIFFAVDFDTTNYGCAVCDYFRGVDAVLGAGRVGAGYGGITTVRTLFDQHLIRYAWQSAAWSYGRWDPRAQLQQFGFAASLDWDRAMARDYGQWPYTPPMPKPKPKPKPAPKPAVHHTVRWHHLDHLITRHCRPATARYRHACGIWRQERTHAR